MDAEDIKFLEDNRTHYDTLVKAFYLRGLTGETRSTMQRLVGKYWQPGYTSDLYCPPCVSDMLLLLYRLYDKWIEENKEPETTPEPVENNAFPITEEFIIKKHYHRK